MAGSDGGVVRAAGGVLWRPAPKGIEVAVVHRPRYDDWSLPKGKLEPGEHAVVGALREVWEETGYAAVPGRTLGRSSYTVVLKGKATPKTVDWWAMRAGDGEFRPDDEVDELLWLPPEEVLALLTAGRDVDPLQRLVNGPLETGNVLLVRHARAGSKSEWDGPDDQRPLDETGTAQAQALVGLLAGYDVARVLSGPPLRCTATVEPLARRLGLPVEVDDAFGEAGYAASPGVMRDCVLALAARPGATVVCTQRGPLPDLVIDFAREAGLELPGTDARKGSVWLLSFSQGLLVDASYLPDPLDP